MSSIASPEERRGGDERRAGGGCPSEIADSIHGGISYLCRHLSVTGRFTYNYDSFRNSASSKYNILRHAGTTMVLYQIAGSEFDDGTLEEQAERAWRYLHFHVTEVERDRTTCACVVEDNTAKLGGAALTVLALAARLQARVNGGEEENLPLLRSLALYVASQQRPNGSFICKVAADTGEEIAFDSVYYPGEAVLALCAAYRWLGDRRLLDHAVRGARHIIGRDEQPDLATFTDHWLMMALAELHVIAPSPIWSGHLRQLATPLLADGDDSGSNGLPCWLRSRTTTEIATRLEGLLGALRVEQALGNGSETLRIARILRAGLASCYERQVGPAHPLHPDPLAQGGFTQSQSTSRIRIDYVQHALAASFGTATLLRGVATDKAPSVEPKDLWTADRESSGAKFAQSGSTSESPLKHRSPQGKKLSMSWDRNRQVISCDDQTFAHEGPINTDPSHDLAHLLIAANGELAWRPAGDDMVVRLAEYNAVFIEHLLNEVYNCVVIGSIRPVEILSKVIRHSRWFAEEHFMPFPLPSEEAYRRFCRSADVAVITRLSPYYYTLKREERCNPALRAQGWTLSFNSGDSPRPEDKGISFRDLVREQISLIAGS